MSLQVIFFIIHLICFVAAVILLFAGLSDEDSTLVCMSVFGIVWNVFFGVIALLDILNGGFIR